MKNPEAIHVPGIRPEVGITSVSVENAKTLTSEVGKPALIVLSKDGKEYITTAYWGELSVKKPIYKRYSFRFTGFSFGYAGEGPNALLNYLKALGVKVDISKLARIQDKELPFTFEV